MLFPLPAHLSTIDANHPRPSFEVKLASRTRKKRAVGISVVHQELAAYNGIKEHCSMGIVQKHRSVFYSSSIVGPSRASSTSYLKLENMLANLVNTSSIGEFAYEIFNGGKASRQSAAKLIPANSRTTAPFSNTKATKQLLISIHTICTPLGNIIGSVSVPSCLLSSRFPPHRSLIHPSPAILMVRHQ